MSRREQEWYEVEKKDGVVLAKAVIKEEKGRVGGVLVCEDLRTE